MILTATELPSYFPDATEMSLSDKTLFLQRANAYVYSQIGGVPPVLEWDPDQSNLKSIVALAFEILAEGETAQIDGTNGNITEAAPTRPGTKKDPLSVIDKMLIPYIAEYVRLHGSITVTAETDRGFLFLGGL